jgi:phosphopantetheinyl transferase
MKTYILSFAETIKHVPEHPERTAMKSLDWDVRYQVWTSRAAMLKTIEMQGKRAPHRSDWRACKVPAIA